MQCVFVQIRCCPGTMFSIADAIVEREAYSELYSTSGDYDLLIKLYVPEGDDIGRFIGENLHDIDGVEQAHTILTFKTF